MDNLMLLLLLLATGVQAEGKPNLTEPDDDVRLVGGDSRCSGELEVKHQGPRRPVEGVFWTLKAASVVCEHLDCGSAVSVGERRKSSERDVWRIKSDCLQSGSSLTECARSSRSQSIQTVTCSDSVRLLNGTGVCSGRLEVKSNQSWSSVCQADFDQQDAEVVCRELGCGPPRLLRGALYGDVEAPVGTKEFQCGGEREESSRRDVWWIYHDCVQSGSSLRDCGTSSSSWSSSSLQTVTCSVTVTGFQWTELFSFFKVQSLHRLLTFS
ncbi:CD5 antigen-like [Pholidichthys leucotaenia]